MNLADPGGPRRPEGLRGRPRGPGIQSSRQSLPGPRGLASFIPRLPCRRSDHQRFSGADCSKDATHFKLAQWGVLHFPPLARPSPSPPLRLRRADGECGAVVVVVGGGGDWKSCRAIPSLQSSHKLYRTLCIRQAFLHRQSGPGHTPHAPCFRGFETHGAQRELGLGRVITSGSGFYCGREAQLAIAQVAAEPLGDIILSSPSAAAKRGPQSEARQPGLGRYVVGGTEGN